MRKNFITLLLALSLISGFSAATAEPVEAAKLTPMEAIFAAFFDPIQLASEGMAEIPYLGLSFQLPQTLVDMQAENALISEGLMGLSTAAGQLQEGFAEFIYIPWEARESLPSQDAYWDWKEGLPKLGRISVLPQKEYTAEDLAEKTGYPENEILASHDGYTFVYSQNAGLDVVEDMERALAALEALRGSIETGTPEPFDLTNVDQEEPTMDTPEKAGAFATEDLEGNPVTEAIFADAKLTMVNVWTTWCGPCLSEMPHLGELSREMAADGVQILGILHDTLDESGALDAERVVLGRTICERTEADYPMLIPNEALLAGLLKDIPGFPTTFFFDADGNTVGDAVIGSREKEEWRTLIEERLALVAQ